MSEQETFNITMLRVLIHHTAAVIGFQKKTANKTVISIESINLKYLTTKQEDKDNNSRSKHICHRIISQHRLPYGIHPQNILAQTPFS